MGEFVINKLTNTEQWKTDFLNLFNSINDDYQNTIDNEKRTMTVFKKVDQIKKGWIYNSVEQKDDIVFTLSLIKIHDEFSEILVKANSNAETQTEFEDEFVREFDRETVIDFDSDVDYEYEVREYDNASDTSDASVQTDSSDITVKMTQTEQPEEIYTQTEQAEETYTQTEQTEQTEQAEESEEGEFKEINLLDFDEDTQPLLYEYRQNVYPQYTQYTQYTQQDETDEFDCGYYDYFTKPCMYNQKQEPTPYNYQSPNFFQPEPVKPLGPPPGFEGPPQYTNTYQPSWFTPTQTNPTAFDNFYPEHGQSRQQPYSTNPFVTITVDPIEDEKTVPCYSQNMINELQQRLYQPNYGLNYCNNYKML